MSDTSPDRPMVGEGLLHPAAVVAVAVLVLNDHWGKAHFPGFLTGKLSDFAGLVFFPLLLQALWEAAQAGAGRRWRPSLRALVLAALATAVVFALVKAWPPASHAYRVVFGALRWPLDVLVAAYRGLSPPELGRVMLTADKGDLVALPAVLVAVLAGRRRCVPARPHGPPTPMATN